MVPGVFTGFDSNADGLMFVTVKHLQNVMRNGGDWPFNQYGPFWSLVYALVTWNVSMGYSLVVMKAFTLLCYFITILFVYRIGSALFGGGVGYLASILILASQPFTFDLRPWPSSINMLLVSMVTYCCIQAIDETKHASRIMLTAGILTSFIFLTRIQIGILLLFIISCFFIAMKKAKVIASFLIGFLSCLGVISIYLWSNGWLIDSFSDQIIYGSTYFNSGSNPLPTFTIFGILAFFILFRCSEYILQRRISIKIWKNISIIVVVSLATSIYFCYQILKQRGMISSLTIFFRIESRAWVSFTLAGLIYASYIQIIVIYKRDKNLEKFVPKMQKIYLLLSISLAAQLQVYPLFDPLHTWWGSVPGMIVIASAAPTVFKKQLSSNPRVKSKIESMTIIVLLVSITISQFAQFETRKQPLPERIFKLDWVANDQRADLQSLQDFFQKYINVDSKVLNLCADTDVYFSNNLARPSTRVFVYWENFEAVSYLDSILLNAETDYIVSCSPDIQPTNSATEIFRQRYIKVHPNFKVIAKSPVIGPKVWTIWKNQYLEFSQTKTTFGNIPLS
jgi:hypothetical protein